MNCNLVFHHIGIATDDISKTSLFYTKMGYISTPPIEDPIQKVLIAFMKKENTPTIELLEPLTTDSPVTKIIEKNGVMPYHICYEVEDITETIKELRKDKFIPLSSPVKAIALEDRLICFLFKKEIGLIELLQK